MKTLDILYQSSSAYTPISAVSILSLLENNRDIDILKLWFIDDNLNDSDKKLLVKITEKYRRQITFLSGKKISEKLTNLHINKWSGSYATFYKLFTYNEIPGKDRVLYIDADTVVLGSLKEFCDIDLSGYACGMIGSAMCGIVKNYFNTPDYFNAGLELINLEYWKANDCNAYLSNMLVSDDNVTPKLTMIADESLINIAFNGKIKKLPLKYNLETSWWLWGHDPAFYGRLGWNTEKNAYYTREEIQEALNNPCIVHYLNLTTGRPWEAFCDHPYVRHYNKYQEMLDALLCEKIRPSVKNDLFPVAFLKWIVKKMMPNKLRRKIGFSQHENAWKTAIQKIEMMQRQ